MDNLVVKSDEVKRALLDIARDCFYGIANARFGGKTETYFRSILKRIGIETPEEVGLSSHLIEKE